MMSTDDWYRRPSWSTSDREDFFARLKRARSSRPQYLSIQAGTFSQTDDPELLEAAISLIDQLLVEHPDSRVIIPDAMLTKAVCLFKLGRVADSFDVLRATLDFQKQFPNVRTGAWLNFGWYAVIANATDVFPEALEIIDSFHGSTDLPVERFRLNAIRALIADFNSLAETAAHHARLALRAANKRTSSLRYHPNIGLVSDVPEDIIDKLQHLVSSASQQKHTRRTNKTATPVSRSVTTSEELLQLQQQLTEYAVEIAENFKITLNFSNESIEHVEKILGIIHDEFVRTNDDDGLSGIAINFAAYIITVIENHSIPGTWQRDHKKFGEDSFPYHWAGTTIFPYAWCLKRIFDGAQDNVASKYKAWVLKHLD